MREVDPTWSGAVFVCTHERDPSKGKPWCGQARGAALRDWLKSQLKAAGLKGVVLTAKSGCLGVCSPMGVTISVLPAGESGMPRRMWVVEDGDDRQTVLGAVHEAVTGQPLAD
jgi:hypothetical protein